MADQDSLIDYLISRGRPITLGDNRNSLFRDFWGKLSHYGSLDSHRSDLDCWLDGIKNHHKEQTSRETIALDQGYQPPIIDTLDKSTGESKSDELTDKIKLKASHRSELGNSCLETFLLTFSQDPHQFEFHPSRFDFDDQCRFVYTDMTSSPIHMLYIRKEYLRAEQYILEGRCLYLVTGQAGIGIQSTLIQAKPAECHPRQIILLELHPLSATTKTKNLLEV